jgi:hypothetical protein
MLHAQAPDANFRKELYYHYEWPNPEGVRPHRAFVLMISS